MATGLIWIVYHTAQQPRRILVEHLGARPTQYGIITEFTEEEWERAVQEGAQGYLWPEVERIEVLPQ